MFNEDNTIDYIYAILKYNSQNSENRTISYHYISFDPMRKETSKYPLKLLISKNLSDCLIRNTTIYLLTDYILFLFDKIDNFLEQYKIKKIQHRNLY